MVLSGGATLSCRGHLAMLGCIGLSVLEVGAVAGIWWVEDREAAKHPTTHRTAPHLIPTTTNRELSGAISAVARVKAMA